MGQAAYERALGLAGWDRFIHTLEQAYERVLDERTNGGAASPARRSAAKFRRASPLPHSRFADNHVVNRIHRETGKRNSWRTSTATIFRLRPTFPRFP